jgi:hypothetical protein
LSVRAIVLAALALMGAGTAHAKDQVYTLPAPLSLESMARYSSDTAPPEARRGLVLQGYYYDAYHGENWVSSELAKQAEACGDRLQLPVSALQKERPNQPVIYDFWLVHSPPEALYVARHSRLTRLVDCVATAEYHLETSRLLLMGDRVTSIEAVNGRWGAPQTLPANDGYTYAADRFLKPVKLDALRKRYGTMLPPPHVAQRFGSNIICFSTSGGMIGSGECRLDQPGQWRGILLNRHTFHTGTHEDGIEVEYIDTNALIDGRLFEWDRPISLASQ